MIKYLEIHGLRGFGERQKVNFAIPSSHKRGSGLTIFVGANNTGKTTIIEALRAFNAPWDSPPTFSEKKRNLKCKGGEVHLSLGDTNNDVYHIDSTQYGGSSTKMSKGEGGSGEIWQVPTIYVLQSRRFVDYEFHQSNMDRNIYMINQQLNAKNRTANLDQFNARIFKMLENKKDFDKLLYKVLEQNIEWTIDQNDSGTYYIKIKQNGYYHSSEGLGDGVWSVFTICDALYDSKPGEIIVIDEPELSLHPATQKKIMSLFEEYASDRQILISTHSPYFIDFEAIQNGAYLYRTHKNVNGDIFLYTISDESRKYISSFLKDFHQPHTFGLEAKEIFFLEDKIILTEGQEDVILYQKAADELKFHLKGFFFGWGSGGASNIIKIALILKELGYNKIFAIFDGDKRNEKEDFQKYFDNYKSICISKDDIRDKEGKNGARGKEGLMRHDGTLKDESKEEMKKIFEEINFYMEE